jgi:hypothetical protein
MSFLQWQINGRVATRAHLNIVIYTEVDTPPLEAGQLQSRTNRLTGRQGRSWRPESDEQMGHNQNGVDGAGRGQDC